jgi:hypothetical protein
VQGNKKNLLSILLRSDSLFAVINFGIILNFRSLITRSLYYMRYELCKFVFGSPRKQIFSLLQIFCTASMAHSDSNVGPVHCLLTGVVQNIFRSSEKNHILNTHNLVYKPRNALNKGQKIPTHTIKFETSINSYVLWYGSAQFREPTETTNIQSNT